MGHTSIARDVPAVRAAQIIIIVLRLSESGCAGRTSGLGARALAAGAPRVTARSPLTRAHVSRFEIWIADIESKIQIVGASDDGPETSKGRLVSLGGPSERDVWLHVTRVGGLRRYRYRAASGCTRSTDGPMGSSRTSRLPTDYVQLVSTRHELRTMKRITAREGSVKRFLDEIDKDLSRLVFRHRGELSSETIVTGALIASST